MTSIILRILILILLLWLLKRVLMRMLGLPRQSRSGGDKAVSNYMVKDPVCGMYMDSRLAVRLDGRKEPLYFCSEECRSKYLGRAGKAGNSPA
jgi:YHS domain-containing protein